MSAANPPASEPPRRSGLLPRRRSRLLLVLFGVLFAVALFAGAELVLRLLRIGEPHELREFPSPDGPVLTREPNWPQFTADASLSLDRIAAPRARREGSFRVVVVGESTAAGFPFYPQLSFARLLEASLRDALPALDVDVVNLGRAADPSDAVARTAIEALELAPDVLVVCSGHNEYQASYVEDLRDGLWPRMRAWLRKLRLVQLGLARVLSREAPMPQLRDDRRIGERPWLTATEFARGEERLRANLDAIVAAARRRAVDVVLVTQASNLHDFAPCYSHFTRKLSDDEEREYERLLLELDDDVSATVVPLSAENTVARLRALDFGVARATFLVAKLSERAGRTNDAAVLFAAALDQDGYPNRARSALNIAIRQLAFDRGVRLADAQALFAGATRQSVPGDDLFLDYCHPTLEGAALLADAIRPALIELLAARGARVPARFADRPMLDRRPIDEWLARLGLSRGQLVGGVVRAGQGSLLVYLGLPANREALVLARRAFEQALRIAPSHVEAEQGLLVADLADLRRDEALARAQRLAQLAPDALRKVEEVSKQFPALAAGLQQMKLEFRDGRLQSAGS